MFPTPIILAALGALGLSVGTHLQHRAVLDRTAQPGPTTNVSVAQALTDPLWRRGMAVIVLATVLNVAALGLAPVAIVQPVGSLALVAAVVISALSLGVRVERKLVFGVSLTVVAVVCFVGISAGFARESQPTGTAVSLLAWVMLGLILAGVLVARRYPGHLVRVVAAGVIFGTVASAVHVVTAEVLTWLSGTSGLHPSGPMASDAAPGTGDPVSAALLWGLVLLLALGTAVGAWLVQTAYASGPPETVLAGLTVIDPLVAVLVGALLLGEYSVMPLPAIIALVLSGLAACLGISLIVRNHPGLGDTAPSPRPEEEPHPAPGNGFAVENRRS